MVETLDERQPLVVRGPTPLPRFRIAVLLVCFLSDALSISVILPVVPYMVHHLEPELPEEKIGYYSGLVASSYTIGQMLTTSFWGAASDKYGRRRVLLLGMFLGTSCLVFFGMAPSLGLALAARFLQGLSAGNVAVAKSALADLTDETNEAQAFALLGVVFAGGNILGPALGGLLSEPAATWPGVFGGTLFELHPYALPCFIVATLSVCDIVFGYFFLPETRPSATPPMTPSPVKPQAIKQKSSHLKPSRSHSLVRRGSFAIDPEIDDKAVPKLVGGGEETESDMQRLLSEPTFRVICLSFMLFGAGFLATNEVLPIWARTAGEHGGMGYSTTQVGTIQALGGAFTLCVCTVLYPRVSAALGVVRCFRLGLVLCLVGFPWPAVISYMGMDGRSPYVWALLVASVGAYSAGLEFCFTSTNLMLKNCCGPELVGTAIGLGSAIGSAGFAIGPVLGGSTFAWSMGHYDLLPYWLAEGRLFYLVVTVITAFNLFISGFLPAWPWSMRSSATSSV